MSTYRKRVSLMEKFYVSFNALRPPFCNQLTVEGTGRIAEDALREALVRASRVNPGATLRLRGALGQMQWVRGPDPELTILRDAQWDGCSEQGAPFLHHRLDPETGPSAEVQYIEAGSTTFLIFRGLHAIMDGTGQRAWVRDFFTALGGGYPAGQPDAVCSTEVAQALTSDRFTFPRADALHPCGEADAVTSGNDYQWRRFTVHRARSSTLLADVALALARQARRHAEGPFRVNVPADLRYFRPDVRTNLNLIGSILLEVAPTDTRDTFMQRLRQALKNREHARLPWGYQWFEWLPLPLLTLLLGRAFASEHKSGRYPISATLSDTGEFKAADCSAAGFVGRAAYYIPPFADQHCFISLNGFADRTDILLALPSVFCSRGRLDGLLEELKSATEA